MLENILFCMHGAILLLFGVYLSAALSDVRMSRKTALQLFGVCVFCGLLQTGTFLFWGKTMVWKLYPLITHLPLILFLCIAYRRKLMTSLAAVFTVYLCCQPSKWFATLVAYFWPNTTAEYLIRFAVLGLVAVIVLKNFAPFLARLFTMDNRSILLIGIMPTIYYVFDYVTVIYTDLWISNNRIAAEFLPFLYAVVFMTFTVLYYRQYEQKADAERSEKLIRLTTEQQIKEINSLKRAEAEVRLLRHDMRLFLNTLAMHMENGETEKARELIVSYSSIIEGTRVERFCENDTVNYVLSDFAARFRAQKTDFQYTVELEDLQVDEILFSSILSNALDNAFNAQAELAEEKRKIRLLLKTVDGKLLLSVKNPTAKKPVFADGLPLSDKKGHGYGTQSIRYMTERLGGNCQFSVDDKGNSFTLRVII